MKDFTMKAEAKRLYHVEKWKIGSIARHFGVHHNTIKNMIEDKSKKRKKCKRKRMVDPFMPFILDTLRRYPDITATRLFYMVKERGYPGKDSQFREVINEIRPKRPAEAYLRLSTLIGEQAQVDWGHFGRIQVGSASRLLMAFVCVLSYSRAIFLKYFFSQSLSNFIRGHKAAFKWYGGVTKKCLYDNLKSVVLERRGKVIRFNPDFLEFSGHYRFEPRPVAIARGNEKGRVERAIRFIRSRFFYARKYKDIHDLNKQALSWCANEAMQRCWPDNQRLTVGEVFHKEKKKLIALPDDPFPCDERVEVSAGKVPYIRFDLNRYSIPHTLVEKTLIVHATTDKVRIIDGDTIVAVHERSYDRNKDIENPEHIEELSRQKTQSRKHRRIYVLEQTIPSSIKLLEKLGESGTPIGTATRKISEFQNTYGSDNVENAICEALKAETPHIPAVQYILERNWRDQGKPPARPLPLPDDPRIHDLNVKPHDLKSYDEINEETDEK